jgi:hypothetical protein
VIVLEIEVVLRLLDLLVSVCGMCSVSVCVCVCVCVFVRNAAFGIRNLIGSLLSIRLKISEIVCT